MVEWQIDTLLTRGRCDCSNGGRRWPVGLLVGALTVAGGLGAGALAEVAEVADPVAAAAPSAQSGSEAVGAPPAGRPLPQIIAHRGASAYLPEHTLEAYQLALDQGADCIEADLVATRDGQLVVRHDNLLNLTTDVADRPQFAERERQKRVDGKKLSGWFSEDFTLAELTSLLARERIPDLRPDSARHDDRYRVVSLAQVLAYIRKQEQRRGLTICFYVEIKHPHYFASLGLDPEQALVAELRQAGYRQRSDPVYIQSFEVAALKTLRGLTELRLVQLLGRKGQPRDVAATGGALTYRDMTTPEGLAEIARYADLIGPPKYPSSVSIDFLFRPQPQRIRALVERARAVGLGVAPYTFRAENHFLPLFYRSAWSRAKPGDLEAEVRLFLDAGVDALFIDNPDIGITARKAWLAEATDDCAQAVESGASCEAPVIPAGGPTPPDTQ